MSIGKNILNMRKRMGMSQMTLAKMTGIGQGQISEYERGIVEPKIEQLSKIADAFRVSVAVLDERLLIPPRGQHQNPRNDRPFAGIRDLIDKELDMFNEQELIEIYGIIARRRDEKKNGTSSVVAG